MEHRFRGTPFTVGIEEEMMLLDAETLELAQGIETILDDLGERAEGTVKPELMQSVLEIASKPHPSVADAAEELRELRKMVREAAGRHGMLLAASGTHPTALWEEQLIVERPRYEELVSQLGYIARQELIFGTHVHVGVTGPNKAVYIADGVRRHLPLLLALSTNSPVWRGKVTGMMSSRTPVFRAFPRAGIPPHYGSWEIYSSRVKLMMDAGAIPDYTYLWFDVRPHPKLGTVEVRVFDQQTRLENTVALAALVVALVHRYSSFFDQEKAMVEVPTELIDDNKVRAALRGMEGELIDFPEPEQRPATQMATHLLDELREHAQEVGCGDEIEGVRRLIEGGTGARRQLEVLERKGDVKALVRELCEASAE
ncbi:MAG: YbdK family carboxylate-amine ligase [Actinomycetota bacterium]